jgi:hypothetical protein
VEAERTAPEIALAVVEIVRASYAIEHTAEALKPAGLIAGSWNSCPNIPGRTQSTMC